MRTKTKLLGAIVAALALVPVGMADANDATSATTTVDLLAGQFYDVGEVRVTNDSDAITVEYIVDTPGWCLTETHLDIAAGEGDHPQTKTGNPTPGKFAYAGQHDCVVSYTYVVPFAELGLSPGIAVSVAAHAVVSNGLVCDTEAIVFGVERGSGDLYSIDVLAGTASLVADITVPPEDGNVNSPNGLAFDGTTGRLYYADSSEGAATSTLYFWDGTTSTMAGIVPGQVAGATFYGGEYYYVENDTDDLVKVVFDADGTVNSVVDVWSDFASNGKAFRFGDIVIDPVDEVLYGSSLQGYSPPTAPEFFSIDLATGVYAQISTTDGVGLQLAFGSNGLLYGHSTGTGHFFTVDPVTGDTTSYGVALGADDNFTDLASGERCSVDIIAETAWGDGPSFPGSNWAMSFTHDTTLVP